MDPSILEDFDTPLEDWSLSQMTGFLKKINLESLVDTFSIFFYILVHLMFF